MIRTLSQFEEKIFRSINGSHTTFLDYLMMLASNLFLTIPIFVIIAIFSAKYYKDQGYYHPRTNASVVIIILFLSFIFCFLLLPQIFSFFLDRTKPCLNPNVSSWLRVVNEDCDASYTSFAFRPCIMFCITSFLFFTFKSDFKNTVLFLFFWSLLVSYSRIYLGVHYPSNVLLADIIGIFCGYITNRMYLYIKYNFF